MDKLLKLWGWVKLNAVMLGIFAAVLLFCVVISHSRGVRSGKAECEAKHDKAQAKQYERVIDELESIRKKQQEQFDAWTKANEAVDNEVETEVKTIYKTLEKLVEVPVYVEGPCNIDYDGTARVLDGAADAAFGDNSGNPG